MPPPPGVCVGQRTLFFADVFARIVNEWGSSVLRAFSRVLDLEEKAAFRFHTCQRSASVGSPSKYKV